MDAYLADHTLEEACDDVLIPALARAKRDREFEGLNDEEARAVYRAARETVEEIADRRPPSDAASEGAPYVLACAATDEADETALTMLGRVLSPAECALELSSAHALSAEIVSLAAERKPAVLFIAALPPNGLAQTRHLCKRLRARFPAIKILVGRWGDTDLGASDREALLAAGADAVGTTLRETRAQLLDQLSLV